MGVCLERRGERGLRLCPDIAGGGLPGMRRLNQASVQTALLSPGRAGDSLKFRVPRQVVPSLSKNVHGQLCAGKLWVRAARLASECAFYHVLLGRSCSVSSSLASDPDSTHASQTCCVTARRSVVLDILHKIFPQCPFARENTELGAVGLVLGGPMAVSTGVKVWNQRPSCSPGVLSPGFCNL